MSATNWQAYTGRYSIPNAVSVEIKSQGGQLVGVMPGMPPGFEIALLLQGEHTFKMQGGPLDGGLVIFHANHAGIFDRAQVGPYEMGRDDTPGDDAPALQYLQLPPLELDDEKAAAFENTYQAALKHGPDTPINYTLAYPKHEFVRYLRDRHNVVFHGTNKLDIAEFQPVRNSIELYDAVGRGNVQGVYATHHGVWSMFYAVLDRQSHSLSMSSGVMTMPQPNGAYAEVYFFAVDNNTLAVSPWTTGMLYILPGEQFRQMHGSEGELIPEWVSETPVKPLAKIVIEPGDFPFLQQVQGFEDEQSRRLHAIFNTLFAQAETATETENGFNLSFSWYADLPSQLAEFVTIHRTLLPSLGITLTFEPAKGPILLHLGETNPVLKNMLRNKLKSVLSFEFPNRKS